MVFISWIRLRDEFFHITCLYLRQKMIQISAGKWTWQTASPGLQKVPQAAGDIRVWENCTGWVCCGRGGCGTGNDEHHVCQAQVYSTWPMWNAAESCQNRYWIQNLYPCEVLAPCIIEYGTINSLPWLVNALGPFFKESTYYILHGFTLQIIIYYLFINFLNLFTFKELLLTSAR
jgi:hypothetical protein